MRYFNLKTGFDLEDNIPIDETELEKAIYCQMSGKVGVFNGGTIRGSNIISIKEDWHRAMGWNKGHVLELEDFQDIDRYCSNYKGVIGLAKQNVQHMIEDGTPELIGKGNLNRLESPQNKELGDMSNLLADKMRIK